MSGVLAFRYPAPPPPAPSWPTFTHFSGQFFKIYTCKRNQSFYAKDRFHYSIVQY